MHNFNDFKNWLDCNSTYTRETKSNIVSRLRRADKIVPVTGEAIYLFNLSCHNEFTALSVNVKSQIRRAVKIYHKYLESEGRNAHG